jgi:hypothetical protein
MSASDNLSLSQFTLPKETYVNVAMQMVPPSENASNTVSSARG